MKQILWLLALGALLAGCSGGSCKAGTPPPPALVQTVGAATDPSLILFSCDIRARHQTHLPLHRRTVIAVHDQVGVAPEPPLHDGDQVSIFGISAGG